MTATTPRTATAQIHVNQHVLAWNRKNAGAEPALTTKRGKANTYADRVELRRGGGAFAVVQHSEGRCWVETCLAARVLDAAGQELAHLPAGEALQVRVDGRAIRANLHTGSRAPVLAFAGRAEMVGHQVELIDEAGAVVATMVYRPEKPLSCGARVWVETKAELEFFGARRPACLPVTRA